MFQFLFCTKFFVSCFILVLSQVYQSISIYYLNNYICIDVSTNVGTTIYNNFKEIRVFIFPGLRYYEERPDYTEKKHNAEDSADVGYLFSELYEFSKFIVDLVGEGRLPGGRGAHVVAVARRQLGRHVGVADLQRQRQLPRAGFHATLVVTLQPVNMDQHLLYIIFVIT